MIEPRVVLITGAAGLLGSRMADWIIAKHPDVQVVGVDDLSGGFIENVHENVIFYKRDISVTESLDDIFQLHKPDLVYHFAAYAAECASPFIRMFNYTNNIVATANVINNCIKYNAKRIIFTSSMATYGVGNPPFSELDKLHPTDPYGVAKYACEMDIQIAGEQHNLDWCILRPHNVYGSKQNIWDPMRNVLGIFMYKTLVGDPITIFGDGLQQRAFSYIDDILEPMWKAGVDSRASREIINIGGINHNTIVEAAKYVRDQASKRELKVPELIFLPNRHEVKYAYSTYDKSVQLLDFEHKIGLYEGVGLMWDWVLTQPRRERQIWDEYELDKEIYPYWKKDALADGYWKEKEK